MRPPSCIVCGKSLNDVPDDARARDAFELVTFSDYVPLPDGMVGHPQGLEWLCADHLEAGQARSHLSSREAAAEIRAEMGRHDA